MAKFLRLLIWFLGPKNTGIWSVTLRPHRYGGPYVIKASSYVNGKRVTATLRDVLFGDVWICSGQSNMEMAVRAVSNERKQTPGKIL